MINDIIDRPGCIGVGVQRFGTRAAMQMDFVIIVQYNLSENIHHSWPYWPSRLYWFKIFISIGAWNHDKWHYWSSRLYWGRHQRPTFWNFIPSSNADGVIIVQFGWYIPFMTFLTVQAVLGYDSHQRLTFGTMINDIIDRPGCIGVGIGVQRFGTIFILRARMPMDCVIIVQYNLNSW